MWEAVERHYCAFRDRWFEESLRLRLAHPGMPQFAVVIFGLTISSTAIYATAASLILGFVVRALTPKPRIPSLGQQQRSLNVNITEPASPVIIVYGQRPIAGRILYIDKRGANGEYLDVVYAIAGHEVEDLGTVWVNDVALVLDGSGNDTSFYAGLIHVEKKLGVAGEAAFPGLIASSGGKWTTNHKLEGQASLYVSFKFADVFNGFDPVHSTKVDVKGKKLYDPRTTLTTWSANPALAVRDYLTAPYGLNLPASKIHDDTVIAAANICDESVTGLTATYARYSVNGAIELGNGWDSDLNDLLGAMAGTMVPAGRIQILAGAWRAPAPGYSLGDDDLRAPLQFDPLLSKRELVNTVKGLYAGGATGWELADFPLFQDATALAQDGEVLVADVRFPFTAYAPVAQRLAKIECERSRNQGTLVYPAKLKAWQLVPGDVVPVTHANFGWTLKPFEVVEVKLAVGNDGTSEQPQAIGVDLMLRETDSTIWDWDYTTEEGAVATPSPLNLPQSAAPPSVGSLAIDSGVDQVLVDVQGNIQARMHVTWTSPADVMVTVGGRIHVAYKKHSASGWITLAPLHGDATEIYITADQGVAYDVEVWAETSARVLGPVTQVTNHTVVGASGAPGDVQNFSGVWSFSGVGAHQNVTLNWDTVAGVGGDALDHYEVRWSALMQGASWGSAEYVSSPTAAATSVTYSTFSSPGPAGTFFIKAVLVSGRESVNAAFVFGTADSTARWWQPA